MQSLAFLMTFVLARASTVINTQNDDCDLQQSQIRIEKSVTTVYGGSVVTILCSSEVTLSKCEGTCESSVTPSVRSPSGFRKTCRCCRETSSHSREVILDRCTLGGVVIPDEKSITVTDITGCSCQPCVD